MNNKFKDWINEKYQEWRGNGIGQDVSVAAYARYLGVARPMLDDYLKGMKKPKSQKNIQAFVAVYGLEVYEILGFKPSPEEMLAIGVQQARDIDGDERRAYLLQLIENYLDSIPGMRRTK